MSTRIIGLQNPMRLRNVHSLMVPAVILLLACTVSRAAPDSHAPRFLVSLPAVAHQAPVTGRLLLVVSRSNVPEVRLQARWLSTPLAFGLDVDHLSPGKAALIDGNVRGYPLRSLNAQPLITMRQMSAVDAVFNGRFILLSGWLPIAEDGYPKALWDPESGDIDRSVAYSMRDRGYDLRYFAQENWPKIGSKLVSKLHFYSGGADESGITESLYLLEEFLKNTRSPNYGGSFEYGRPAKGHGWQPMSNASLMTTIAEHIAGNAPSDADRSWRPK